MPCTSRQALTTPRIAIADMPLQLREGAQDGRVQGVVASFGPDIGARRFEVSRNAKGGRLRIALERDVRRIDLAYPRQAEQSLAQERGGLHGGRRMDAPQPDIQREV